MYAANDHMRPMTSPRLQLIADVPRQFLRIGVKRERPLLAIGQLIRLLAPAVRRGENDRQVARQVFDISVAPEISLAGLVIFCEPASARARNKNENDENPQPSVAHHSRDRNRAGMFRLVSVVHNDAHR